MLSLWSQSHHPLFIDTELTLEPSLCLPRGTILVMVAGCVCLCACVRARVYVSVAAQVRKLCFFAHVYMREMLGGRVQQQPPKLIPV